MVLPCRAFEVSNERGQRRAETLLAKRDDAAQRVLCTAGFGVTPADVPRDWLPEGK